MGRPPPTSPLFPYTTLFRSRGTESSAIARLGQPGRAGEKSLSHGRSQERISPVPAAKDLRSEEHTSELQSLTNLVCRLLLEKKKHKIERSGVRWATFR